MVKNKALVIKECFVKQTANARVSLNESYPNYYTINRRYSGYDRFILPNFEYDEPFHILGCNVSSDCPFGYFCKDDKKCYGKLFQNCSSE